MILDLFSGGGAGWCLGARALGLSSIGIEWGGPECATRAAVGLTTIRADVSQYPPERFVGRVEGLCGSPPCQSFSSAGKGLGLADPRGQLVHEPMRWVRVIRPRWVALEQVPEVLGYWRWISRELAELGYSTWCGILNAADYGKIGICPLHDIDWPSAPALCANRLSRYATELASALVLATTKPDVPATLDALTVVGHSASRIRQACVDGATPGERAKHLVAVVDGEDRTTPDGPAVDTWTNEATSVFGAMGVDRLTSESIGLWLRNCWADLSRTSRLSTTSMNAPATTIRATLRSIAATFITSSGTGLAPRSAGCGLCFDLGVPQVRKRAILLASLDRRTVPPAPTHSKTGHADLLGEGLARWVSMAEALGWPSAGVVTTQTNTGGSPQHPEDRQPYECGVNRPAPTVLGNSVGRWKLQTGTNTTESESGYERDLDRPAPTVMATNRGWRLASPGRSYSAKPRVADPAPTIALGHNAAAWCWERPATTVMGDQRVFPPGGHHPGNGTDPKSWSSNAIPVEPWELGVLQGFPADHPWQPPHVSRQIGNAVPPPLAEACLRAITGANRLEAVA